MTEDDQAWSPRIRETIDQLQNRVAEFLSNCLVQRPETNIVIVSHGVWIEACFHRFCPEALDHGKRRVYNCDIFAGDCVSKNGKFVRLQNMQQIH